VNGTQEGKGFAEVTGRDTGRTAHGKPKCGQGHAISGSRVAPPEREEERRCFAGLNWTVTSRRGYSTVGQMVSQGRQARHEAIHEGKKKNNETRLGASLEELSLEIESTVLKLTSEDCLARLICIIAGRILLRHKTVLQCGTFERDETEPL
jgi:hypothetical protein